MRATGATHRRRLPGLSRAGPRRPRPRAAGRTACPSPRRRSARDPRFPAAAARASWTCCGRSSTARWPGSRSISCAPASRRSRRRLAPAGRHGDRRRRRDRRRPRRARRGRARPSSPHRCSSARPAWPARWPRALGLLPERAELPRGPRWLVVAGSVHPATRAPDPRSARGRAHACSRRPSGGAADGAEAIARLAAQARGGARQRERWDLVVVTGGETAVALWTALGAERIDLLGAPAPGLALGQLRVRGREPLTAAHQGGRLRPARPARRRSRRRPWREASGARRDDGRPRRRRARRSSRGPAPRPPCGRPAGRW